MRIFNVWEPEPWEDKTRMSNAGPRPAVSRRPPVRLLHLSDLHFSEQIAWDQEPILATLVQDVAQLRARVGEIHRVVVTGDIANQGKKEEYDIASAWLRGPLADAAGVNTDAIRVVQGNHDVQRSAVNHAARALDAQMVARGKVLIAEILRDKGQREIVLQRSLAFLEFARSFHTILDLPWWRQDEEIAGRRVRLIGLSTAWLAGSHKDADDKVDDHRHLIIGAMQWHELFPTEEYGKPQPDLTVALMHHPWEDLAERDRLAFEAATHDRCAVIMRGHLHDPDARAIRSPGVEVLTLAAGACYADADWPHGYQLVELDPDTGEAQVYLRRWDSRTLKWTPDNVRWPEAAPGGIIRLPLRQSPSPANSDRKMEIVPLLSDEADRAALKAYCEVVRPKIEAMPWLSRQLGLNKTLTDVYVQVEVRESDGLGDQVRNSGRQRLIDILGPAGARWAMLGEPGSGKSTLLRWLVIDLMLSRQDWLPVLLHASEFQEYGLIAAVRRAWGERAAGLVGRWNPERLALLVDGLDEAGPPRQVGIALQAHANDLGLATLIVAGRPEGMLHAWGGFGTLQILPLADPEQENLLLGLGVSAVLASRSLMQLRSDRRLIEIAARPLLLTLAALVLLHDGELPDNRTKLYQRAMDCLLYRGDLNPQAPKEPVRAPETVEAALVFLASRLLAEGEGPWTRGRIIQHLRSNQNLMTELQATWSEDTCNTFLDEIGRTVGILVPQGVPLGRAFGFPHRTLGEYLASRGLVHDAITRDIWVQSGVQNPAAFAEVLALTIGQLRPPDADALVRQISVKGKVASPLLHRLIADAEGLAPETVLHMLGMRPGWEKWKQRKELFEQIPTLVSDARMAIRLLDRLRRSTTDGNDLYWIREALREIATREGLPSDVLEEVRVAIHAVFRHMQGNLERVKEQLTPWWRRIPAGSSQIGSTDYDDEQPEHDALFTTSFAMLGVPVTWAMYLLFDPGHASAQRTWAGMRRGKAHDRAPVYRITWYAATMFAEWLGARLPLEPEWEYACRAGTMTRYWSGEAETDLARVGWYAANSNERPHAVAEQGQANPWGLHDVHGNVREWCQDEYDADVYKQRASGIIVDPANATWQRQDGVPVLAVATNRNASRAARGGSWGYDARGARSSVRYASHPSTASDDIGFRLVLRESTSNQS